MSHKGRTALYYISHFLLAGQPAEMLERLWSTYELDESDREKSKDQADESSSDGQWKTLDETLKETYRATGVMVSLGSPFQDIHHALPTGSSRSHP